uniref:Cofilin/actin-depolymerizing factor homolog n=1 Tax=Schistocephalus solidus TaxID=70667 RepID=A0A0X3P556_SCHSO
MASGVTCTDACLDKFTELKLKKSCRYVLYKIVNEREIVIDKIGDRACTFDDFKDELKNCLNDARYSVFDFEPSENKPSLIFVTWIPDTATVRTKMLYASSLDALKTKLVGIKAVIQLTAIDDVTPEYFSSCLPTPRN